MTARSRAGSRTGYMSLCTDRAPSGERARDRTYTHGDQISLPDICLAAQITGNQRFDVDLSPYPAIRRISLALKEVEAFLHQLISLDCGPR